MIDDKLKTGHEPPGPERSGDAPAKEAPLPPTKLPRWKKRKSPTSLVQVWYPSQNSLLFLAWVRTIQPDPFLVK